MARHGRQQHTNEYQGDESHAGRDEPTPATDVISSVRESED